jgi:hypothetical protein
MRTHKVMGKPSTLAKILIFNKELLPQRTTVILVREPIGSWVSEQVSE